MKTLAWILGIGGAAVAVGGWLSARAHAQTVAAALPVGTVVPPGVTLTTADAAFISSSGVTAAKLNAVLIGFALYKSNFAAWVAEVTSTAQQNNTTPPANLSATPQNMTFSQYAQTYGG